MKIWSTELGEVMFEEKEQRTLPVDMKRKKTLSPMNLVPPARYAQQQQRVKTDETSTNK